MREEEARMATHIALPRGVGVGGCRSAPRPLGGGPARSTRTGWAAAARSPGMVLAGARDAGRREVLRRLQG